MKIHLHYSAYIRQQIPQPDEVYEAEDSCTLQELIGRLADRYGDAFGESVFDAPGRLRPMILLSLNDQQVDWRQPVILKDGDRVALLSPIAGG
ncbi:MAG: MoaD/ThiS family protein [Candidatus Omnitrophica bacterium]|nr:MoaD/ThiS family protein [Candidatus Omnitrophota bacterium]